MIHSCGEALVDLVPDPVPGGGPMNVAIAVARLGAPSSFVGAISTDEFGDVLWAHLAANGVDLSSAVRVDAPTARAIVEHVPELRFRFEGDGTADTLLAGVDRAAVAPHHIVHGGTLGMFRGVTAATLADLVERHDGVVSLDPNVRPQIIDDADEWRHFHDRWLPHVDLYKGSDEDLAWIWPESSPDEAAQRLLDLGVTAVVVTRGADGLTVVTGNGEVVARPPAVDVVDTVGAGDTIVGTVLTSIWELRGQGAERLGDVSLEQWRRVADRAVAAAAITVTRAGADVPYRDELDW